MPPEPSDMLVSGRRQGLPGLLRTYNLLEKEIKCFNEQLVNLDLFSKRLLPRYSGNQVEQLNFNYVRVQTAWKRLQNIFDTRKNLLNEGKYLYEFLVSARELICWLEYARDLMEHKERPRLVYFNDKNSIVIKILDFY